MTQQMCPIEVEGAGSEISKEMLIVDWDNKPTGRVKWIKKRKNGNKYSRTNIIGRYR